MLFSELLPTLIVVAIMLLAYDFVVKAALLAFLLKAEDQAVKEAIIALLLPRRR